MLDMAEVLVPIITIIIIIRIIPILITIIITIIIITIITTIVITIIIMIPMIEDPSIKEPLGSQVGALHRLAAKELKLKLLK